MKTNEKLIEINNSDSFAEKTTETPETATSISNLPLQTGNIEKTFSSIIPSVQKFFLPDQASFESFDNKLQNMDQKTKQYAVSCEQILSNRQQKENLQTDFQVILQNSEQSNLNPSQINILSTDVLQLHELKILEILSQQQISMLNINQEDKVQIVKFSVKVSDLSPSIQWSIVIKMAISGFERSICVFSPKKLKENAFYEPKYQLLIKQLRNQELSVMIPFQKIAQIKKIESQLKNKSPYLNEVKSIKQLKGILYDLCQQNMGSRIIQKLIHLSPQESIELLQKQLWTKYHQLMMDKYGNYVVQKIFLYLKDQEKIDFIKSVSEHIPQIAKTKFGTFCLQYILKKCRQNISYIQILANAIKSHINELSTDEFATHFLQELIQLQANQHLSNHFFDPSNFFQNSKNKFGILTIKALMSKVCPMNKQNSTKRIQFLNLAYNHFQSIVIDEYGHFLIQQLLKYYQSDELNWVFWSLNQNLALFVHSTHSLSVIQKYLEAFSHTWVNPLIFNVLSAREILLSLMETKTGSFLIHMMILLTDHFTRCSIIAALTKSWPELSCQKRKMKWKSFLKTQNFQ